MIGGTPNPLANEHARKALAYATDRQADRRQPSARACSRRRSPFSSDQPVGHARRPERLPRLRPRARPRQRSAQYEQDTGAIVADASAWPASPTSTPRRCCSWCRASGRTPASTPTSSRSRARRSSAEVVKGDYQAALFQHLQLARPRPEPLLLVGRHHQGLRRGEHQLHPVHDAADGGRPDTGRTSGYPDVRKKAYDDLVTQLNAGLGRTSGSTGRRTRSSPTGRSTACRRPARSPFGNFQPKTWLADLWHQ